MYDRINEFIASPDYTSVDPQTGDPTGNDVDPIVAAWFGAAAQVNLGQGGASDIIRVYTQSQIEIRAGESIANIDDRLQESSDAIAEAVFNDIRDLERPINGETFYELPSAIRIGEIDAIEGVDALSDLNSNPAIWSGNFLYLGLGSDQFWNDTVLEVPGDTYDLIVSLQSMGAAVQATIGGGFANAWDLAQLFLGQGLSSVDENLDVFNEGMWDAFVLLTNAYGSQFEALDIGAGAAYVRNFSAGTSIYQAIAGPEGPSDFGGLNQPLQTGSGDDLVNAGNNDNLILGSLGIDIIDGGAGYDSVSFERLSEEYSETINFIYRIQQGDGLVPFSGSVTNQSGTSTTLLYEIEEVSLGAGDDVLIISELESAPNLVHGAGNTAIGDSVDLSELENPASVNLGSAPGGNGSVVVGGHAISIVDFENVVGSAGDDTITGNDADNHIEGGLGADLLDGGLGDDFIFFDAEDLAGGSVRGGGGRDVGQASGDAAITIDLVETELEVCVGTTFADEFTVYGAGQMVACGDGDDTITLELSGTSGPTIVWGGAGADTFVFRTGGDATSVGETVGIFVLTVEGLTQENFHEFDLNMIGVGADFDWSQIDAVIINPDASDRVILDEDLLTVEEVTYRPTAYPFGGSEVLEGPDYIYTGLAYPGDRPESGPLGPFSENWDWRLGDVVHDYAATFLGDSVTTVQAAGLRASYWNGGVNSYSWEYRDGALFSTDGIPITRDPNVMPIRANGEYFSLPGFEAFVSDADWYGGWVQTADMYNQPYAALAAAWLSFEFLDINSWDVHFSGQYPDILAEYQTSWPDRDYFQGDRGSGATGFSSLDAVVFETPDLIGPWFVAGGGFETGAPGGGSGLAGNGDFIVTMPDDIA